MIRERDVTVLTRILTIALLVGGAAGAVSSFTLQKGGWPWPMPDLAYRFLAGAAAAYAAPALRTEDTVSIVVFAVVLVTSAGLYLRQRARALGPAARGAPAR